jgi:hypothetical protein
VLAFLKSVDQPTQLGNYTFPENVDSNERQRESGQMIFSA